MKTHSQRAQADSTGWVWRQVGERFRCHYRAPVSGLRDPVGMADQSSPPSGTVTFLFTDVEGSTRLWAADAEAMSGSLRSHDAVLEETIAAAGGYVFARAGDSFAAAFGRTSDAVSAAERAQAELSAVAWSGPRLGVRMGLHLGEAEERGGDYFGPAVNLAARIEAAGHGGQVLASRAVIAAADVQGVDLGEFRLRGLDDPVGIVQVNVGEFPALRSDDTVVSSLPSPRTSLVGRDEDIAEVRRLLAASRLVTISGVGGCGKTRLAIEVGHREAPSIAGGVFFVGLVAEEAAGVTAAFAAGVGVTLDASSNPVDALVRFLAPRAALLVVDNCEHLLDEAADIIDELLIRCSELTVLATSREPLEVDGERTWRVPSLVSGSASSANRLFVERAGAAAPQLEFGSDADSVITEICERLDGIPLAIELAASRARTMPLVEIRDRLDDRFRLLAGGRNRARQRQVTLEATVQWSYGLLDESEQRMLGCLATFRGGFDLTDVAPVAGVDEYEAIDMVDSLLSKSLVEVEDVGEGRLRHRLLETVRLFALQRLVELGEANAARDRHLDRFLDVHISSGWMAGIDYEGDWRRYREFDNFVAACEWATETGRPHLSVRLAAGQSQMYAALGRTPEAIALLEQPAELGPEDQCLAGATAAWLHAAQRLDVATTQAHIDRATAAARGQPWDPMVLVGMIAMSTLTGSGLFSEADRAWIDVHELAAATPTSKPNRSWMLQQHALNFLMNMECETALAMCREAKELAPEFGFRFYEPITALALMHLGRIDEAAQTVEAFTPHSPANAYNFLNGIVGCLVEAHTHPDTASQRLSEIAEDLTPRRSALIGEFVVAFAYLAWLRGDNDRALQLAENSFSGSMLTSVQVEIIASVRGWPPDQIPAERSKARQAEPTAERIARTTPVQADLYHEELATRRSPAT